MPEIQDQELIKALNDICTFLMEGEEFHKKSASECRKLAINGWADWHTEECKTDKNALTVFMESLKVNSEFALEINSRQVDRVKLLPIKNIDDFRLHHIEWLEREEDFADAINFAIEKIDASNAKLKKWLELLVDEVQSEIELVKYAYTSLKFGDWMGHDISVKSKWMVDYFKKEYKEKQPIKFNIG